MDIDAGDELVERIKPHVARTMRPEVLAGLGGFAGLCALPKGYREPLLVSCTDGVGTKLKLAFLTGRHDTVGIDLVAMNVNDMVVSGAEPLLFLDYFASGKLEVGVAEQVIAGIADGCRAGRLRPAGRRDRRAARLLPARANTTWPASAWAWSSATASSTAAAIAAGRRAAGPGSSGFHSNGYSLVRKVFLEHAGLDLAASAARRRWHRRAAGRRAAAPDPHLRALAAQAVRRRPAEGGGAHHRRRPGGQPHPHVARGTRA